MSLNSVIVISLPEIILPPPSASPYRSTHPPSGNLGDRTTLPLHLYSSLLAFVGCLNLCSFCFSLVTSIIMVEYWSYGSDQYRAHLTYTSSRNLWRCHLPPDHPQTLRDQSLQSHTQTPKAPRLRDSHPAFWACQGTREGQAPDPWPGAAPFRVAGRDTYLPFRSFPYHAQLDFPSAPFAYGQPDPNPVTEPGWQLITPP